MARKTERVSMDIFLFLSIVKLVQAEIGCKYIGLGWSILRHTATLGLFNVEIDLFCCVFEIILILKIGKYW